MSIPGSLTPLFSTGSSAGGYQVQRSLRFNSSDSGFCSRTPAVAGNRQKFTLSFWWKNTVKSTGFPRTIFAAQQASPQKDYYLLLTTNDSNILSFSSRSGGDDIFSLTTTSVFRDPSAWYHIVIAVNTTIASPSSDRVKIYVNGTQITAFSTATYPSHNLNIAYINESGASHFLGRYLDNAYYYLDSYLADVWFLDGLTPSTAVVNGVTQLTQLGEFDATTGVWNPKAWDGAALTGNSFHLYFADNSALTSGSNAGIGKDTSGLGNYWNTSGLSVTAGAGNDSLVDSPTSYGTDTGAGGAVRGNYCTLNPLDNGGLTLANGNLDFSRTTASWLSSRSTFGISSGKWYWEVTLSTGNDCMAGISKNDAALSSYFANVANGWAYNAQNGQKYNNGSSSAYGNSWVGGNDTVGVAFDADAGSIYFYKNGAVQNSGNAAFTGLTSGPYFPSVALYGTGTAFINFGQRAFAYQTPGTNRPAATFLALCDTNLGAPVVAKPNQNFDIITYPGNGSTQTLPNATSTPATALDFGGVGQIGFSWIKQRSDPSTSHALYDARRGVQARLESDTVDQEATSDNGVTAFNAGTFALGSQAQANSSSETYVAWCWATAAQDSSSHTQGSITSQVRANVSAGFSIVKFTPSGAGQITVGHGLGASPGFIIVKTTNLSANWYQWVTSLTVNEYLTFTSTAKATSANFWGTNLPSSTVFGYNAGGSFDHIAYCFAPVVGYSSFGSYTGNGLADGPFVYTGFRPRWVMVKQSSASGEHWVLIDTARDSYNIAGNVLYPSAGSSESSGYGNLSRIDILSNGFKARTTNPEFNASATYIYAAFAENPFQYARAR